VLVPTRAAMKKEESEVERPMAWLNTSIALTLIASLLQSRVADSPLRMALSRRAATHRGEGLNVEPSALWIGAPIRMSWPLIRTSLGDRDVSFQRRLRAQDRRHLVKQPPLTRGGTQ